jgi:inhibitor of KinA
MRAEPLGDSAYILRDLEMPAYELAERLNAEPQPGLIEAVASYETVGLYVDSESFSLDDFKLPKNSSEVRPSKLHVVPVCYEMGQDLEEVCAALNLSKAQLVEAHTSARYRCYAVGFCPGFAYLGYLPPMLQGIPRRSSPRTHVPPGSVAITGRQTAVYPLERPGGWALIGLTPLCLVDVEDRYFPIQAGDEIQFQSIGVEEFQGRVGERL